ncbi:helix-turn-helix domain-containing protein [Candidatus Poriferisodalis sp.]|uniref:helix-turn-helix domain-containing protein n=1 Tax=Candidatus Poriferisodalis sp. TaxID=3101277 RepID=UPI003D13E085
MEPKLIELARVGAGLTQGQLAKKLGKSQPFVSQVEHGEKDIPSDLIPYWCDACDVPESFLLRGRLPLDDSVSAMVHRRMKTLPAKPHHLANAQVKMRVLEVDSLLAEIDLVPSLEIPRVPVGTGPVDAAAYVRRSWRVPAGPLPNLVELIESTGIPVVLMNCFHPKQSATSHPGTLCDWVITVNDSHPASRRRYTLAHELGHVVLRHEAVIAPDDAERSILEVQADAFAAELLMPQDEARRELRSITFRRLVLLKQRWRVSIAFLIRRALDVGTIDPQWRKHLEIELSTQPGGRRREPAEFEPEEPSLIRRMIEALQHEGLSIAEIASLAGMTERRLRMIYLREPDRPRLLDNAQRVVVELPRPSAS